MATEQQKLDLEVEKLDAEIRQLKRPAWRTPAGITAIVAVAAFAVQYAYNKREYQLAELEKAQVANEKIKLEHQNEALKNQLEDVKQQRLDEEETETKLRKEVALLNRFLRNNSGLSGANALIEKLRSSYYPLTIAKRFTVAKTVSASTAVSLSQDGALKLSIKAQGVGNTFSHKGFTVDLKDIETGAVLKTLNTGPLSAKGKQAGFIMSIDFKRDYDFTVEPTVMNRVYVPSQITIGETGA